MVLEDLTNIYQASERSQKKCDEFISKPDVQDEAARNKELEQENLKLRARLNELEAQQQEQRRRKAAEASTPEPRTPRRRAASESSLPCTPRTPRTPKAVVNSAATPRWNASGSSRTPGQAGTPRSAPTTPTSWGSTGTPRRHPDLGKPLRRRPQQESTTGPKQQPGSGGSKATPSSSSSKGSRDVARANALLAADRRCTAAHEALPLRKAALAEWRKQRDQATQRADSLGLELREASAGHPERLASLQESFCAADAGLQEVQRASEQEKRRLRELTEQEEAAQARVSAVEGELAAIQARQQTEGAGQQALVDREKELAVVVEAARRFQEAIAQLMAENGVLARRLNNEILSLKGNVRVFCRMRPRLLEEKATDAVRMEVQDDCLGLTVYDVAHANVTGMKEHTRSWDFEFDHVFRPGTSQATCFEEISCLVQSALDGYRVAILAYGQTGSGKTHTMLGGSTVLPPAEDDEAGMIPRTVDLIFKEAAQLKKHGWELEVHASMAEVYNDQALDLLASRQGSASAVGHAAAEIEARIAGVSSMGCGAASASAEQQHPPFRRVRVRDAAHVHSLLHRASRERHVATTAANERSSRSHAVFQLFLTGRCRVAGREREVSGMLSFVDLAGSERLQSTGAVGERLKEAQHINRSLCALGDVIEAIGRKSSSRGPSAAAVHVPYRNSRLTMLLRDCLGGDSKTLMFVNISPLQEHLGETLSSLRFASKVHACTVGVARRHAADGTAGGGAM